MICLFAVKEPAVAYSVTYFMLILRWLHPVVRLCKYSANPSTRPQVRPRLTLKWIIHALRPTFGNRDVDEGMLNRSLAAPHDTNCVTVNFRFSGIDRIPAPSAYSVNFCMTPSDVFSCFLRRFFSSATFSLFCERHYVRTSGGYCGRSLLEFNILVAKAFSIYSMAISFRLPTAIRI